MQPLKLPEQLDRILNEKCISHSQVIQAITTSYLRVKAMYGESESLVVLAKEIPKTLMIILKDEHVDKSSGELLDAIALRYNIFRGETEDDIALRDRIKRKPIA